jgi:nucleoside-diphosphate-sugar epimerase
VGVIGKIDVPIADESSACNPMNAYEETKLAAERIVSSGFGPGAVAILRPTNVFTSETLRPMLSGSATVTARLLLKGRENTHFVYVEDVAAAAEFCWSRGRRGSLETFIVSSDEEEGGSFLDVQAILAAAWPEARQPPPWSAPTWVPRCLRRIIGRPVNRADLIYSSLRLRTAGFRNPFGRARGLEHAVAALRTV